MRIAVLADGIFPYVIGGIQRHSYYLCKHLAQKGIHIDLYHTGAYGVNDIILECFSPEEMKFIRPVFVPFPANYRFPGHYLYESKLLSKAMYKAFLKQPAVDFIYAKNYCAWYFLEQKQKGQKLAPIGVKLHGYEAYQEFRGMMPAWNLVHKLNNKLHRNATEFISQNADVVFSYGGGITSILEREVKVPPKKMVEIPTGIDESWLSVTPPVADGKCRFIFVGRNTSRKGADLVQAWLNDNAGGNYEFHFVGPFPESKNGVYHGEVKDSLKLQRLFSACNVLVCPSDSEGMPNVIMEAMARGLAVIATNVGAVSAMVDSSNGWLIPRRDKQALTDAMKEAMDLSPGEMRKRGQASLEKVRKNFLWKNIADQVISAMKQAAG